MTPVARRSLAVFALLVAGCSAAKQGAPPASAPSGGGAESPDATGEQQLKKSEGGAEPERPAFNNPGYAEPPQASLDDAQSLFERDSKDLASALATAKDCGMARKALDSMKRSADRICELNGPDDPGERCAKARDRVEAAHENVRRGCGS